MENYNIYCTEEQTLKALILGAPIDLWSEYHINQEHDFKLDNPIPCKQFTNGYCSASCPTAEQMRGWLKTQGVMIEVCYNCTGLNYNYSKLFRSRKSGWGSKINNPYNRGYISEKEATLAAIDAALDYLCENKI